MTSLGGERFGARAALCAGAILAVGVAAAAAPAERTGRGAKPAIVKIKLPHAGDFTLAEIIFRVKAKPGSSRAAAPTLRLLNESKLPKSVLVFGGVARLQGKPGTFGALVAIVNRKAARTTTGAAQGDEADLSTAAGGEIQSTDIEQNVLEGGTGGEPFPGPPSESDMLSHMGPAIYTKANWPIEIAKRPLTLAKGMLEIAVDVRAGKQPDAGLIRSLIDAGYAATPPSAFACNASAGTSRTPGFTNDTEVDVTGCAAAVSAFLFGPDNANFARGKPTAGLPGVTEVSKYFAQGNGTFWIGDCSASSGIVACDVNPALPEGGVFVEAFGPKLPPGTKILMIAKTPDGKVSLTHLTVSQ